MDFETLQRYIAEEDIRLREKFGQSALSHEWVLAQTVKLMEEVGELSEQVLASQARQRTNKTRTFSTESLGAEIADVMIVAMLIGQNFNVDIPDALQKKIAKNLARHNDT